MLWVLFKTQGSQNHLHCFDSLSLFLTRFVLCRESFYIVPAKPHNLQTHHCRSSEEACRVGQPEDQALATTSDVPSKYILPWKIATDTSQIILIKVSRVGFQNTARASILMPFTGMRTTRSRNISNLFSPVSLHLLQLMDLSSPAENKQ